MKLATLVDDVKFFENMKTEVKMLSAAAIVAIAEKSLKTNELFA
jgi:hypothetical protein